MSDHSPTVLLIGSNKEDREYWAHRVAMASPEYVVLEADTAEAGLAICRWQKIDCVLVELDLPDISNLVLRARRSKIPIIVLTPLVLYPMGDLAMKSGAQAYLVKSHISEDILNKAIQQAIAMVPH